MKHFSNHVCWLLASHLLLYIYISISLAVHIQRIVDPPNWTPIRADIARRSPLKWGANWQARAPQSRAAQAGLAERTVRSGVPCFGLIDLHDVHMEGHP